tara:strand:+ start:941 stop:1114 length:174 start_codon:yes stop_codon:yes gene_type:complete
LKILEVERHHLVQWHLLVAATLVSGSSGIHKYEITGSGCRVDACDDGGKEIARVAVF